jgi:molybdate transport system ATP-binding protein
VTLEADLVIARGPALIRATLSVGDGETLALLGPNGAGKTTLIEAVAGLVPAQGPVAIDGEPVEHLPPERRRVGLCFQADLLFPTMSALENVAFGPRARGGDRAAARGRARDLLARLAPSVDPGARPSHLSGGERQRVALARALASEPRVLLLDEPLAAVDVGARAELRGVIREVVASFDGACVLVAHDPLDALTLADNVTVLEAGRVTQTGTPEDIRRAPRTPYAADLVGVNLFVGSLEPAEGGARRLVTEAGEVLVAGPGEMAGSAEMGDPGEGEVTAVLRPSDVSLHASEPEGSARNVFRGRVTEVAVQGDRARVRLDTRPPLVAEVTLGSVDRLGLRAGVEVWSSFKAVEVAVVA